MNPPAVIPKQMRALVYRGQDDLRVETVPVPRIGARELLVKVAVCGVCPTDIKKIHYGTVPPPRIFGHETAGTIVRTGALVRGFRVGQRVALHHHVPCLDCHYCRHRTFAQCPQYKRTGITAGFEPAGGGFAEYVRVMSFVLPGVVPIPKRNAFAEGAMLEPVNTVLKGVKRLNVLPGDTALVIGQGPIGLLFTRLLKLQRLNVIAADLQESRLRMARAFGARWVVEGSDPERIRETIGRRVMDCAVVAVASDAAVRAAQVSVRQGGQVLLFAHTHQGGPTPVNLAEVCAGEKDLIGSYSSDFTLQREVARSVFSRGVDVRPLISHCYSLDAGKEAVAKAAEPDHNSLKVFIGESDDILQTRLSRVRRKPQ